MEKCRASINKANDFPELEDARTLFRPIQKMEEKHANALPDVYDKLSGLQKLYEKKVKKQKQEYIELAKNLMEHNDYRTAYDLYKEAAEALPDDDDLSNRRDKLASQMGYIYVTEANFANRLNSETIEGLSLRLKAEDMRYLTPHLVYNSLMPTGHATVNQKFTYKIIDKKGNLDHSSNSPDGYPNDSSFEVLVGEHNQGVWLSGWGNATQSFYEPGEYTFELYYKGHKIFANKFTLY